VNIQIKNTIMKKPVFHPLLVQSFCLLLVFCGYFLTPVKAQDLSMTVQLLPAYPIEVDYYLERPENLIITLQNNSGQPLSFYVGATLSSEEGVTISSLSGYKPVSPIELSAFESRIITGNDLDELGWEVSWPADFSVSGISQEEMDRLALNRTLPEGQYRLCFTAYQYDSDAIILESCTDDFDLRFAVAPVIISPENMELFTFPNEPLFVQWMPVYSNEGLIISDVEYGLQILAIDTSDRVFGDSYINTLFEARTNIIYEETGLTGQMHSIDLQELESLEEEKLYVIRVVAEGLDDETTIQNDGASNLVFIKLTEGETTNPPASMAFIYPEEAYTQVDAATSSMTFRWNADLPFGMEDSVHFTYTINPIPTELGTAADIANLDYKQDLQNALISAPNLMLTTGFTGKEVEILTDSLPGSGTYIFAVRADVLAKGEGAVEFEKEFIFKAFDYDASNASMAFIYPEEAYTQVDAATSSMTFRWNADLPFGMEDSVHFTYTINPIPTELGTAADIANLDYKQDLQNALISAPNLMLTTGFTGKEVEILTDSLPGSGTYIFAVRADVLAKGEGAVEFEKEFIFKAFDYDASNASMAFIYPEEAYTQVDAATSSMTFRWNADLPFGMEDSVHFTYTINPIPTELGTAADIANLDYKQDLQNALISAPNLMLTTGFTGKEVEILTDSLPGSGTYIFAVRADVLAKGEGAVEFEKEFIFKAFDYDASNASMAFIYPEEAYTLVDAATSSMTFRWNADLPFSMEDSVHFTYTINPIPTELGTAADIANLDYKQDLQNALISAPNLMLTTGFTGKEVEILTDSLPGSGTYIFAVRADVLAKGEGAVEFEKEFIFKAFDYDASNAMLTIIEPEGNYFTVESDLDSISFAWKTEVPEGMEGKYHFEYAIVKLPDGADYLAENVYQQSYVDLISSTETVDVVMETHNVYDTTATFPVDSLSEYGNYLFAIRGISETENPDDLNFGEMVFKPFTFTQSATSICQEDCYFTETLSSVPADNPVSFTQLEIGHFTVKNLDSLRSAGGLLSGKGEITVDFLSDLRVKVSFTDVSVNSAGRIYEGTVKADFAELPVSMEKLNGALEEMDETIEGNLAEQLHEYLSTTRLLSALGGANAVSLPVGLQKGIKGHEFFLGITSMTFEADKAICNVATSVHLPTMGDDEYIALGASGICMTPGGFGSEFILHMADDLNIQQNGNLAFTLSGKAGSTSSDIKAQATYMEVDCEGIKGFALRGAVALPTSTVVPENEAGEALADSSVTARFAFQIERGGVGDSLETAPEGLHWVAALDIEPFQIKGLTGWGFEMAQAWLDMSDLANPDSLHFPEGYPIDETDQTWTGFYLQSGHLRTPKEFMGGTSRKSLEVADLIVDPTVSVKLNYTDIIQINEGNVDGWAFSLDTLQIAIEQNTFEAGSMKGRVNMPVMDSTESLTYQALLSMGDTSGVEYDFVIDPTDNIQIPMWVAKANLESSSYISLHVEKESSYFDSFLKGNITLDLEKFGKGEVASSAPATLKLPALNFEFGYHSRNGFKSPFFGNSASEDDDENEEEIDGQSEEDDEVLAGADQPKLSGFPISLKSVDVEMEDENVALVITPQVVLMGDSEGFAASTAFRLTAAPDSSSGRKRYKLDKVGIDAISLKVDVANILLEGSVEFYREDNSDGGQDKGTRGALNVNVPGINLGVNLAADFGTRVNDENANYGTEDYFGYWYVDGLAYLGTTGIPISWVTLHGLGGGVSVNMRRTTEEPISPSQIQSVSPVDSGELITAPDPEKVQKSGTEREPYFGARSASFTLVMALVRQELINMDLGMELSWQKGEGIQSVSLKGDSYFFTPINQRNNPQLRANKVMTMSFLGDGDFAVDMDMDVYMNFGVVKGGYEDNQMIKNATGHYQNYGGANGKGYWDVVLGDYETPGKAKINWGSQYVELEAETYFMAGQNVPTSLPPLPEEIQQLLTAGTTSEDGNSVSVSEISTDQNRSSESVETLQSGNGLAHGATLRAEIDLDFGILYGDFNAVVGHDINITQDKDRVCYANDNSTMTPGVSGWYGTGQAYAGIRGELGVRAKLLGKQRKLKIMDLGAALALEGGAPNPVWFEGRANVSYNIMNGTIEGNSRFAIALGDKCQVEQDEALANLDFIGEIVPEGREVNPYTDPAVSFNMAMDEVIYVPQTDESGTETVEQYRPYLHEFSIEEQGVGNWSAEEERWNGDKTIVSLRFKDPFTPKKSRQSAPVFNAEVKVRAEKWNEEAGQWEAFYYDGQIWEESEQETFRTGTHPRTFDDSYVLYSNPLNRQRFFLQDENIQKTSIQNALTGKTGKGGSTSTSQGVIAFKQNMSGFFPASDKNGTYTYLLRFRTPGEDDLDIDLPSLAGQTNISEIYFELPTLNNEALYAVQVVRKNTRQIGKSTENMYTQTEQLFSSVNADDTYEEYTIQSRAASAPQLSEVVERNEELLYVYYFRTSAYNTLEDKLAGAQLSQSSGTLIELSTDESFDQYDVLGDEDGDGNTIPPKIRLVDPFNGDYHADQLLPLLRDPILAYESHMSNDPKVVGQTRYSSHPYLWIPEANLRLDYRAAMDFDLNEAILSGVAGPLGDQEIRQSFSALFNSFDGGTSKNTQKSTGVFSQNNQGQGGNLTFALETMAAAEEDAQTLTDWGSRLLSRYFFSAGSIDYHYTNYMNTEYSDFIDWYDALLNRGTALTKYHNFTPAGGGVSQKGNSGKSSASGLFTTYDIEFQAERSLYHTGTAQGTSATLSVDMSQKR
jgi:hypothetical protein